MAIPAAKLAAAAKTRAKATSTTGATIAQIAGASGGPQRSPATEAGSTSVVLGFDCFRLTASLVGTRGWRRGTRLRPRAPTVGGAEHAAAGRSGDQAVAGQLGNHRRPLGQGGGVGDAVPRAPLVPRDEKSTGAVAAAFLPVGLGQIEG